MTLLGDVKRTMAYGKTFGCELRSKDVAGRLISEKVYEEKEISLKVESLKVLKSRVENFEERNIYKKKMKRAKVLGKMLGKRFNDILMIGVTGSVAAGYPKRGDDIDLLVITGKNRLWVIRLSVLVWLRIRRINFRRAGREEKANDFCFNLWLEEDSLRVPIKRQSLRSAVDLVLIKRVWERGDIFKKFIQENGWVKEWVATPYQKIKNQKSKIKNIRCWREKNCLLMDLINLGAFWIQYWYMKKKLFGEVVDTKRAFFHIQ